MGRDESRFILYRRYEGQGKLENHGCVVVWYVLLKDPELEMGRVRSRALDLRSLEGQEQLGFPH